MTDKQKQGKKNRASGAAFERKVRTDLEQKGWIVDKWTNNVEFYYGCSYCVNGIGENLDGRANWCQQCGAKQKGKLIPAKSNRFNMRSTGFPDFVAYQHWDVSDIGNHLYEVIGVEVKSNGYLDKTEKEKCQWLLENNIFSKILIAYKEKEGRNVVVKYKAFEYGK